jgi:hypothetical protein
MPGNPHEVSGESYTRSLKYYSINMQVGDEIVIFYDPQEPGSFYGEGHGRNRLLWAAILFGIALFGVVWS